MRTMIDFVAPETLIKVWQQLTPNELVIGTAISGRPDRGGGYTPEENCLEDKTLITQTLNPKTRGQL